MSTNFVRPNLTGSLRTILFAVILCSSAAIGRNQVQARLLGRETPSYIDFERTTFTIGEDQTNLVVSITRSGDFRQTARVDFNLVEGTATEGTDYKSAGGTLVFAAGQGFKTVTIPIVADSTVEGDETFSIAFSNPSANVVLMHTAALVTIQDTSVLAKESPKLTINPTPNQAIYISWEADPEEYVLERSTSPVRGAWEEVSMEPEVLDGRCAVLEPITNTFYAYRLRSR